MKKAVGLLLLLSCIQLAAQEVTDYYSGKTEVVTSNGCVYSITSHEGPYASYTVEKKTNTLQYSGVYNIKTKKYVGWAFAPDAYAKKTDFHAIVKNILPGDIYLKYNSLPLANITVTFNVNPQSAKLMEVCFSIYTCGKKDILSFPPDYLEKLEEQFFKKMKFLTDPNLSLQVCRFDLFDKKPEEEN